MNEAERSFEKNVLQCFTFLGESGFTCVHRSGSRVRYETENVFIDVCHGGYDYEIGIEFGRIGREERFSFTFFVST
jgi:hypothetical protein